MQHTISVLSFEFAMKDMGNLSYFLDISTSWDKTNLFLSEQKYELELL